MTVPGENKVESSGKEVLEEEKKEEVRIINKKTKGNKGEK